MNNDFHFALRRIFLNRITTIINIAGLSVGLFVSIVLLNYVYQELNYDQFHNKSHRTYKVISHFTDSNDNEQTFAITLGKLAQDYKNNFSQVEDATLLYGPFKTEVDFDEQRMNNLEVLRADYEFIRIFDYPGLDQRTFSHEKQAILSAETAQKMFDNPLGKRINIEGQEFVVSAVVEIPVDTRLKFDVLLPLASDPFLAGMIDGGLEFETYFTLKQGANNPASIALLKDRYDQLIEAKWPNYEADNRIIALKEVYTSGIAGKSRFGNGNKQLLLTLALVATVILLLALINYVNLQTANNQSRIGESRLKRILGAGKWTLWRQGMVESILVIWGAGTITMILVEAFYGSALSHVLGAHLLTPAEWPWSFWGLFVLLLTFVGAFSGSIPALKLFQQGRFTQNQLKERRLSPLTVGLVIFQFLATASLLTIILFINLQVNYLRDLPKGFDDRQVMVIDNLGENFDGSFDQLQAELAGVPGIEQVAGTQAAPGRGASGQLAYRNALPENKVSTAHIRTTGGYASTLNLKFLAGKDFQVQQGTKHQFILNEEARNRLFEQGENAVGQEITVGGRKGPVVGIVENYHFLSFHHEISPLVLNIEEPYRLTLLLKVSSQQMQSSLDKVNEILKNRDPKYVLDYHFLDDQFDRLYQSDLRTQQIITYSTIIALSISVLGLLALSIFAIDAKTKEIAIRKALGAGKFHVFAKLSARLVLWIFLGSVLSVPLSYFFAGRWVEEFVYQVGTIHLLWISPLAAMITLTVAMTVISRKLHQTMNLNPAVFLRYE